MYINFFYFILIIYISYICLSFDTLLYIILCLQPDYNMATATAAKPPNKPALFMAWVGAAPLDFLEEEEEEVAEEEEPVADEDMVVAEPVEVPEDKVAVVDEEPALHL